LLFLRVSGAAEIGLAAHMLAVPDKLSAWSAERDCPCKQRRKGHVEVVTRRYAVRLRRDVSPGKIRDESRQEGPMTTAYSVSPAVSLQQLAREKAFRLRSNLALGREVLIAVALLAAIGLGLSIGSSALELIALK